MGAVSAVFQPRERQGHVSELNEQGDDVASEMTDSKPQSPEAAATLGKHVLIVGGNDHNVGKQGVVVGFDADGDPQVRLSDGTAPYFCRDEISVYDYESGGPSASGSETDGSPAKPA